MNPSLAPPSNTNTNTNTNTLNNNNTFNLPRSLSDFINHPLPPPSLETPQPLFSNPLSTTTSLQTTSTTPTPNTSTTSIQPPESPTMPLRTSNRNRMVETRTTKPTLMTRLRGRNANSRTVKTTTTVQPAHHNTHTTNTHHTTAAHHTTAPRTTRRSGWGGNRRTAAHAQPVVHHKRHATIGDKVSGAMMRLRGSLTRRPGLKAAGTRRMHGTDGRGSHRAY